MIPEYTHLFNSCYHLVMEFNNPQPEFSDPEREGIPDILPLETEVNSFLRKVWARIDRLGLSESVLRIGSIVLTTLILVLVVHVMGNLYATVSGGVAAELVPESTQAPLTDEEPSLPIYSAALQPVNTNGIGRIASLHTILPSRARTELVTYEVQPGDSIFSIAEKFMLKPESILWGNRYNLSDDPHFIILPGQGLYILPIDGTLHKWSAGERLDSVASFYHVTPEAIINYAPNGLTMETVGDFASPNISPDTLLIVPGGYGEFSDWRTPRIPREDPAVAKNVGPGACEGSYDGVMGTLNFTWPTVEHYLSGYDFNPTVNHFGIDIAGEMGSPITAADNGVVVYAGTNDWGYGEMIVIDHGKGWQTLYAHLSTVEVNCGQEVYRGDEIGTMGSTGYSDGPHLHFELRSDEYGRLNPFDFLQ